jgi:HAE1 family hydrophobic/amphiphilic exporter-1
LKRHRGKQEASGRGKAFEYVLNIQVVSLLRSSMESIILRSSADGFQQGCCQCRVWSSMYDIYSNLNGRPSAAIVLKQSFGSNANQVDFRFKSKTRGHQEKVPERNGL